MIIKIELLSDLCTYSGESFHSLVDIDVVYDNYGIPYIPAKRLKGCIREACLELVEFGVLEKDNYNKIFGKEENFSSKFSLSNAYLENYQALIRDINKEEDKVLTNPQKVLELYTYTRTQTALDKKTGVAEKNSLRTIRVVKKGLIFQADLYFDKNIKEEEKKIVLQAAKMVTHIGYSRTRGLGLVRITSDEKEQERKIQINKNVIDKGQIEERNKLNYRITLLSAMLCKSPEGNQTKTQNYIEGSKVLGMLAGAMEKEDFCKLLGESSCARKNELIVSNAYIEKNGNRCTPLRASLQKEKEQTFEQKKCIEKENTFQQEEQEATQEYEEMKVYDMLFYKEKEESQQLMPVGYSFAEENGFIQTVETEINYHHRRPEDKSIGKAKGKDESNFYQLESIRKNQTFRGFILANREQTKTLCEVFQKISNLRMGHSKSTEYGEVDMQVCSIEPLQNITPKKVHDFVLKLNSPVILYNRYGMLSADIEVLKEYLEDILGATDLEIQKPFLKYETIGGFNVTWQRRKPVFSALGKGTVCLIHSQQGVDISKLKDVFIGERVKEGYGEIEVTQSDNQVYLLLKREVEKREEGINPRETNTKEVNLKEINLKEDNAQETDVISCLARIQVQKEIEVQAREKAQSKEKDYKVKEGIDAIVNRLILICMAEKSYKDMEDQVKELNFQNKKEIAINILEDIKKFLEKKEDFLEENKNIYLKKLQEKDKLTEEERYKIYSMAYLSQVKYMLKPTKLERRK